MNKYIKKFTNVFFKFFKIYIFRDKFLLSAKKWFDDDGDNLLRLNYNRYLAKLGNYGFSLALFGTEVSNSKDFCKKSNLNQESIVFDVGGYEGDFSKKIYDKYYSNIYIFEPVESFYLKISNRFKDREIIRKKLAKTHELTYDYYFIWENWKLKS